MTAVDVLESRTPPLRTGANGHAIPPDAAPSDLAERVEATAAVARANAATVDRDGCFPQDGHDQRARRAPDGHHGAARVRRREREHRRGGRRLLPARPELRLDRDDLCHAPDQGCLPGQTRQRRPMAPAPASPHRRRAASACLVDDGRQGRRQRALQRGGDRNATARRSASSGARR